MSHFIQSHIPGLKDPENFPISKALTWKLSKIIMYVEEANESIFFRVGV